MGKLKDQLMGDDLAIHNIVTHYAACPANNVAETRPCLCDLITQTKLDNATKGETNE